jgi:hypothetical protein
MPGERQRWIERACEGDEARWSAGGWRRARRARRPRRARRARRARRVLPGEIDADATFSQVSARAVQVRPALYFQGEREIEREGARKGERALPRNGSRNSFGAFTL